MVTSRGLNMPRTNHRPKRSLIVGGIIGTAIVSGIAFVPCGLGLLSLVTFVACTLVVSVLVFAGFFWLAVLQRQEAYVAVAAVAGGVTSVISLLLSGLNLWWLAYAVMAGALGGGFGVAVGNIDEPKRKRGVRGP